MPADPTDEQKARTSMRCVLCGEVRAWPDAFPTHIYAECWKCCWDRHSRDVHPPRRRFRLRWPFTLEAGNG